MNSSEDTLQKARSLSVDRLAQSIKTIGFECTDCGECCTGNVEDEHVATVFPDEVRSMQEDDESWEAVAKPMPFGLTQDSNETFEWALQTDDCGSCVFYDETMDEGGCTRYADRPMICQTYPFSVEFEESDDEIVEQAGEVVAYECEGLGTDIAWSDAVSLAKALKRRAIMEANEERRVVTTYREGGESDGGTVVYDSEGVKRPDGTTINDGDSVHLDDSV